MLNRPPIWIPLALLIGLSGVIRLFDLDLVLQTGFWLSDTGWHRAEEPWVLFLYRYGPWPAVGVGAVGGAIALASRWQARCRPYRVGGLYVALLLVIGPGLIVNWCFKDQLGRPRPRESIPFEGSRPFRPLGHLGPAGDGKSFPSGHASTGFFWLGLFVYHWPARRKLAWFFAAAGIFHGSAMGIARMAQGGHWASDVLWSAGLIYITGWILHFFIQRPSPTLETSGPQSPPRSGVDEVPVACISP